MLQPEVVSEEVSAQIKQVAGLALVRPQQAAVLVQLPQPPRVVLAVLAVLLRVVGLADLVVLLLVRLEPRTVVTHSQRQHRLQAVGLARLLKQQQLQLVEDSVASLVLADSINLQMEEEEEEALEALVLLRTQVRDLVRRVHLARQPEVSDRPRRHHLKVPVGSADLEVLRLVLEPRPPLLLLQLPMREDSVGLAVSLRAVVDSEPTRV